MKNSNNQKLLFELAFIKIISEKNSKNVEKVQEIDQNNEKSSQNPEKIEKKQEKQAKIVEKQKNESQESEQNPNKQIISSLQKPKTNEKIRKTIEKIKQIRIDNTLAHFNKQTMKSIIPSLELLNDLLLDQEYSNAASIILDGTLKAASEENLIFVYKTKRLSDQFNENLLILEETIEKILNKKYNLIATDLDEWEIIKNDFNNKLKPFIYKEEQFNLEDIFKDEEIKNNIETMFEDIIEYN